MANDPTHYQPPRRQPSSPNSYDRTQPAPSLQPPPPAYQQSTQPAYGYNPPPPNLPRTPNPGKPWLKTVLLGAIIIGLMLLVIGGVAFFASRANGPESVVDNYYSSVKQQDYVKAFSYVHFPATTGNQGFSLYKAVAQALDRSRGPVSSYSEQSKDTTQGQTTIYETVQRRGSSYTVRLTLLKFDGAWKIISFTTI